MKTTAPIGSPAWIEKIFQEPPARDVTGRSRPTQRYLVSDMDGNHSYAEGGNTAIGRAILTTMAHAGIVERFKLEPFRLTEIEHGVSAIPDLMFRMNDGRVFVAETKSARFLTEEKLEACSLVESIVNQSGMKYLFWTDSWPLSPACWRVMRQVRRHGTSDISRQRITDAIAAVKHRPLSLGELRVMGIYVDAVLSAVWSGDLSIDLFSDLTDATLVGTDPHLRCFDHILNAPVRAHNLWKSLPKL